MQQIDNYQDYKKDEEHQFTMVKFVCKIKHSPGNEQHLHKMLKSHLQAKGLELTKDNEIWI